MSARLPGARGAPLHQAVGRAAGGAVGPETRGMYRRRRRNRSTAWTYFQDQGAGAARGLGECLAARPESWPRTGRGAPSPAFLIYSSVSSPQCAPDGSPAEFNSPLIGRSGHLPGRLGGTSRTCAPDAVVTRPGALARRKLTTVRYAPDHAKGDTKPSQRSGAALQSLANGERDPAQYGTAW